MEGIGGSEQKHKHTFSRAMMQRGELMLVISNAKRVL